MARLVVARVISEDPWRTETLEVREGLRPGVAERVFEQLLDRLESQGYECYDHGAAEVQLCVRIVEAAQPRVERLLIKLEPEPLDHEAVLGALGVLRGA